MANNTDVEQNLIIRAKDLSSETMKVVSQTTDQVTNSLNGLTEAAKQGEGGTAALNNKLRDAAEGMKALVSQQGALDRFVAAQEKLSAAGERKDNATTALDQAKAETPAKKSDQTPEQTANLKALTAEARSADAAFNRASTSFNNALAKLQQMGLTETEVTSATAELTQRMVELAEAATAGRAAQEGYAKAAALAADKEELEKSRLAEAVALAREEANERKRAAEIIVAAAQARAAATVKAIQQEEAAEADYQKLKEGYRAQEKRDADEAAANAKKQADAAAELAKFQGLATQQYQKYQPSDTSAKSPVSDLAAQLDAIRAPADAARSTLQGVSAEVTSLGTATDNTKLKQTAALGIIRDLTQAQIALARQAGLIDAYKAQDAASTEATAKAHLLAEELAALGAQANAMTAPSKEMEAAIKSAGASFTAAAEAADKELQKLNQLRMGLDNAKINYQNLDGEIQKIKQTSNEAASAMAKAQEVAGKQSGQVNFLGLQKYELINLSYQINDVFTQLASGTKASQVAAQQGGQIFQIFEKDLFSISRTAIMVGAGLAALTAIVVVVNRALANEDSVRNFNARLIATGETANASGVQLTAIAKQAQQMGMSFDDARKVVSEFMQQGLDPSRMLQAARAAKDMNIVFGTEVPDAAQKFVKGTNGGMEAVLELNKDIHFLTPALYDLIKAQFDAGNAAQAHVTAANAASEALRKAGAEGASPLSQQLLLLKNRWNEFLDSLANSSLMQGAIAWMQTFLRVARDLTDTLSFKTPGIVDPKSAAGNSARGQMATRGLAEVTSQQSELDAAKKKLAGMNQDDPMIRGQQAMLDGQQKALDKQKASLEAVVRETQAQQAAQDKANNSGKTGTDVTNQQALAAHVLADGMRDARVATFDDTLRGDAAVKADKARLDQLRVNAYNAVAARGAVLTDELKQEIDFGIAKEDQRMKFARQGQTTDERAHADMAYQAELYRQRGLKGEELYQSRLRTIQVDAGRREEDLMQRMHMSREEVQQKFGKDLAGITAAEIQGAQQVRDAAAKKAGDKALNAEESLEKQLLAMRAKIDGQDKTDLDKRIAGVNEEFAKIEIMISKARRAGASKVGELSIDQFRAEIEALKQEQLQTVELETREAQINKLLEQRKALEGANNELVKTGARSQEDGFKEALRIASMTDGKIKSMAQDAITFAKAMGGANPSPKIEAFIAKMQQIGSTDSMGQKGSTNTVLDELNAGLARAAAQAAARDTLEKAERDLKQKGLQTEAVTEDKVRAAYDRTSKSIRSQTQDVAKDAAEALKAGKISVDQYELIIAKAKELHAETNYLSDSQKELAKGIDGAIGSRTSEMMDSMIQSMTDFAKGSISAGKAVEQIGMAFANMVANVLMDIAKLIIKQLILAEISALVAYLTGGTSTTGGAAAVGGATSSAASVGSLVAGWVGRSHDGGIVGDSGGTRTQVDMRYFVGAPRYHEGGLIGLQPDEYPTILQKHEEVLSANDPRNALNGGKSSEVTSNGSGAQPIRQVLVMNPKDTSSALASSHGEKVVMTHIKNNIGPIRSMLKS